MRIVNEGLQKSAEEHLKKDPIMRGLIEKLPIPKWSNKNEDLFQAIIENIIGQQLSSGPADIITQRFIDLFGSETFPTALEIIAMPGEKIRACGTSWAKVAYIKNFCQFVVTGKLDLKKIKFKSNEKVIEELTQVKGIGRWTAEMILIFRLQRPDVFSLGDLGLRTAVSKLYNVDREDLKKIEEISLTWKPYRSIASRYLWKSID